MMPRRIAFTLGSLAVVGLLIFFTGYMEVFARLFSPQTYLAVLEKPETSAGFLGNFVGGLLTIVAGLSAVYVYTLQERRETLADILKWMSELREKFHSDKAFKEVRTKLAQHRKLTQHELVAEFHYEGSLAPGFYPTVAELAKGLPPQPAPNWEFLREFTDYLYFFEEVLSYGELLKKHTSDSASLAPVLVDHFGWFLRALYRCCDCGTVDKRDSSRFFIHYLAENRYRRLAEVGLFIQYVDQPPLDDDVFFTKIIETLRKQRSQRYPARDVYPFLRECWKSVIIDPTRIET